MVKICMRCGQSTSERKCECGSTCFLIGVNFEIISGKLRCMCGNKMFKKEDSKIEEEKKEDNYKCTECEAGISIVTYKGKL